MLVTILLLACHFPGRLNGSGMVAILLPRGSTPCPLG